MNREQAYQLTLDALAKLQWNTAMILEAKAIEAEKVRNWLLTHITGDTYVTHPERLSTSLQFHEHNVELIEGLTKLCHGLNRNMKAVLQPEGEDSEGIGGMGGMGGMFGGGFGEGDNDG
ncbi:restriction endonuclease subunit S [Cohnella sp. AR92]|uniref:restriction endonuclease subunit S n=1 Tax=Cohnella sp. AR92 TaxID=648716 RepID=UPI000F8F5E49|nr:restriction endonuclease subunit S [Cohnella sp. AR92]RUS44645.1 restriction endonuclease subunit S [Cohnella sp. AR92]